jgi:hypothetical protein
MANVFRQPCDEGVIRSKEADTPLRPERRAVGFGGYHPGVQHGLHR